jgi:hypothetical protein
MQPMLACGTDAHRRLLRHLPRLTLTSMVARLIVNCTSEFDGATRAHVQCNATTSAESRTACAAETCLTLVRLTT